MVYQPTEEDFKKYPPLRKLVKAVCMHDEELILEAVLELWKYVEYQPSSLPGGTR